MEPLCIPFPRHYFEAIVHLTDSEAGRLLKLIASHFYGIGDARPEAADVASALLELVKWDVLGLDPEVRADREEDLRALEEAASELWGDDGE